MSMPSKEMTAEQVIEQIEDGMTVGIGGWGSRRKPMALVRAILRSNLKDLTLISYAGPDAGLLLDAGKVREIVYPFATLDSIPLEPLFSRARQDKTAKFREWDEGMFQTGLRAAASRVPFLPMRAGLGSAVMENDPTLKTVTSPYDDGETLLAVPALELDVALVHMNRADKYGNAQYLGPDPYFDDLFCMAAKKALSPPNRSWTPPGCFSTLRSSRCCSTAPWWRAWSRLPTEPTSPLVRRPMSVTRSSRRPMPPQPRPLRIGPPSKLDSCRGAKLTTKTPCRHSPRRPTDE